MCHTHLTHCSHLTLTASTYFKSLLNYSLTHNQQEQHNTYNDFIFWNLYLHKRYWNTTMHYGTLSLLIVQDHSLLWRKNGLSFPEAFTFETCLSFMLGSLLQVSIILKPPWCRTRRTDWLTDYVVWLGWPEKRVT